MRSPGRRVDDQRAGPAIRRLTRLLFLLIGLSVYPAASRCETRRALMVGIDHYALPATTDAKALPGKRTIGRTWNDLAGCVNDVESIRSILTARFGFKDQDILVIENESATRAAILTALRQQLVEPALPGDACMFYYAGHGSQVRNSKSDEADHLDETIVPADAHSAGDESLDIRDKELASIFNDILDKGALLTVFFDSCHSGSIARGLGFPRRIRSIEPDSNDVRMEHSDPRPKPEERGALIFSAAQEAQLAAETTDGWGQDHGIFSLMLARTLQRIPVNEPASRIAASVRALVVSEQGRQMPEMEGTAERRSTPLFGRFVPTTEAHTVIAIERVNGQRCRVLAGVAVGLYPGCELVASRNQKSAGSGVVSEVRLRIESTDGLNCSSATVIAGNPSDIHAGDLYEVDSWIAPEQTRLRVWIPPVIAATEAVRTFRRFAPLATARDVDWIDDPTEMTPTFIVSWKGQSWSLSGPNQLRVDLGAEPSADDVVKAILHSTRDGARPSLYVQLPPTTGLANSLGFGPAKDAIVGIVRSPEQAHYVLAGRLLAGQPEYAWVMRDVTRQDIEELCPLPARTDWCSVADSEPALVETATKLQDLAFTTARVRGWLQLVSPPERDPYSYHLLLRNLRTGDAFTESGNVYDHDRLQVFLHARQRDLEGGIRSRYVYVFAIDSDGRGTPIFLSSSPLPNRTLDPSELPLEIPIGAPLRIQRPFGIDTYVLLTSVDPVPDPETIFCFRGVRLTDSAPRSGETPLQQLLYSMGSVHRGLSVSTPATWSIERVSVRSSPRP